MTLPMNSGPDCVRAWEAMPWALQGSVAQEEEEWLQRHLAHCEPCRTEFAQQSRLHLAMALPSTVAVDADAGLQRLLARIDTSDSRAADVRARPGNWLSRALVAAVLVQALGFGALGVKLWTTDGSAAYRTLSSVPAPTPPDAIRVVPAASMTIAEWNALLHALRLRVVGGPNAVGAYTVAPADSASSERKMLLQRLRAARGIRFAEPVATAP